MDLTELLYWDEAVAAFFISSRTPAGSWFFRGITCLGEWYGQAIMLALFALYLRRCRKPATLALWPLCSVCGSYLLLAAVKNLIQRERPAFGRLVEAAGYSFPSQHSALSVLLCGWLAFLLLRQELVPEKYHVAVCAAAVLMPLFIGISRMYLNVHYCTDVLAGWTMGGLLLWGTTALYTAVGKNSLGKNEKE